MSSYRHKNTRLSTPFCPSFIIRRSFQISPYHPISTPKPQYQYIRNIFTRTENPWRCSSSTTRPCSPSLHSLRPGASQAPHRPRHISKLVCWVTLGILVLLRTLFHLERTDVRGTVSLLYVLSFSALLILLSRALVREE